jgi:DNA-directed RNA polymerase subunit RPC12/RpoP
MDKLKPMLMQLAEPEYMCPECGFKFYLTLNEDGIINYFPTHCGYCNKEFVWTDKRINQ